MIIAITTEAISIDEPEGPLLLSIGEHEARLFHRTKAHSLFVMFD